MTRRSAVQRSGVVVLGAASFVMGVRERPWDARRQLTPQPSLRVLGNPRAEIGIVVDRVQVPTVGIRRNNRWNASSVPGGFLA